MKKTIYIFFEFLFLCLALQAQGSWKLLKTEPIADDTIKWYRSYRHMVIVSSKEDARCHTAWDMYYPRKKDDYQRNLGFVGSKCWQEAGDIQKLQLMRLLTPEEIQTIKHIVNTDSIESWDVLIDVRIAVNYKENWLSVLRIGFPFRSELIFTAPRTHEFIQQMNTTLYYPQWEKFKPRFYTGMEYVESNISLRKYEAKALLEFLQPKQITNSRESNVN